MNQDEMIVRLTDRAVVAVKTFIEELGDECTGDGLRVSIKGGGCAGYQYALDFSDALETDFTVVQDGVKIYIDPISAMMLEGTTIDYAMGLSGVGFKFDNPNAKKTCGCGSSFVD